MATLNLSCNKKADANQTKIIIQNDKISVLENDESSCVMNIKNMFWNVNTASCYKISVPINGYAEFSFGDISGNANIEGKFIAIQQENSVLNDQKFENNKTYFSYGTSDYLPLGSLTILTGTSENRLDGTFKFYNGTPSANVNEIADGVYPITLSIIAGF